VYCALLGPTTVTSDEERLYQMTNPEEIKIGISYTGPHIQFPLTILQLQSLISAFKSKQVQFAYKWCVSHACMRNACYLLAIDLLHKQFVYVIYLIGPHFVFT